MTIPSRTLNTAPSPADRHTMRTTRHALLALAAILTVAAGCSTDTNGPAATEAAAADTTTNPTPAAADTTGTTTAPAAGVGATQETSGLQVTLHAITDPWTSGNQFDTPTAGHRYLMADIGLANPGDQPVSFSSLLQVEVVDTDSQVWDATFAGTDLPSLDGDIPASGTRRGSVVVEVPEAAVVTELRVKGSFTAEGAVWQIG